VSELRTQKAITGVGSWSADFVSGHHQSLQGVESLEEQFALMCQRHRLVHNGAEAEELAEFIKCATKTRCRFDISEATHRVVALFDAPMILFQSIVQIRIAAMENVATKCFANRSWIGAMPIGRDLFWSMADHHESLCEKALGSLHISLLTEHELNEIAIPINSTVEIAPPSMHFHIGFIHMPRDSCLPSSLSSPPLVLPSSR
jgi:hypothetical protein